MYTAIMFFFIQQGATESFAEQAEVSVKTNFWGTLNVCNSLFPLLRPHARLDYPYHRSLTFICFLYLYTLYVVEEKDGHSAAAQIVSGGITPLLFRLQSRAYTI